MNIQKMFAYAMFLSIVAMQSQGLLADSNMIKVKQKAISNNITNNFLKKFPMRYQMGIGASAAIGAIIALGFGSHYLISPNTSAPSILERLRYRVFGGTIPTAPKAGLVQLYLDTPPEKREELVRSYQRAYSYQDVQQIIDQAENELES